MSLQISKNLSLPVDAARRVFSILAMRGAGKSYAAAVLMEEMFKAGVPIIVLDPMGIFWGLKVGKEGTGRGIPVVVFGGEHSDLPLDSEKAEKLAQSLIASGVSCVIDISEFTQGETQRFIPKFLNELRRIGGKRDTHVFMEEADVIAPQKPMRDETYCLHAVDVFVRRGGNKNFGCTLISQRSAVVNKNVLTQSDFLVVMRTNAPQDKDAVAAWAVKRTSAKKELNAWLDSLSDLEDGEAYIWGPDMNLPGVQIKFRERETFHATRENLKRFDAAKIRPMDVTEFIDKFRDVFEGRKPRKPLPVTAPTTQGWYTERQGSEGLDVGASKVIPPEPRPAKPTVPESPKQAPDTTPLTPSKPDSSPPSEIELSHQQLVVKVAHSEKVVRLDTESVRGQVVYVLMESERPLAQSDIIQAAAEHGWNIDDSYLSKQMSALLVKPGFVVKEGRAYRLPRFVRFDVKKE